MIGARQGTGAAVFTCLIKHFLLYMVCEAVGFYFIFCLLVMAFLCVLHGIIGGIGRVKSAHPL